MHWYMIRKNGKSMKWTERCCQSYAVNVFTWVYKYNCCSLWLWLCYVFDDGIGYHAGTYNLLEQISRWYIYLLKWVPHHTYVYISLDRIPHWYTNNCNIYHTNILIFCVRLVPWENHIYFFMTWLLHIEFITVYICYMLVPEGLDWCA